MKCSNILDLLDDLVDGELEVEIRNAVEEHLAACRDCRDEHGRLLALLARARDLPREIPPSRDLLPGIRARISETGESETASAQNFVVRWGALAAALLLTGGVALSVLLLRDAEPVAPGQPSASAVPTAPAANAGADPGALDTTRQFRVAEKEYAEATGELMALLERRRSELPPGAVAVLDTNLEAIDRAIADVRAAIDARPERTDDGHTLAALHHRKLKLLWKVSRLSS